MQASDNTSGGAPMFIGQDQVKSLLTYEALIPLMATALEGFSNRATDGGVVQPIRSVIDVEDHSGFLLTMPAYSRHDNALAVKLVTLYPNNADLPSHQGCIALFDSANGRPLAILDAEVITGMRTAAASAVAVKCLLDPQLRETGGLVLAVVGSGVQAEMHVQAMLSLKVFSEVRICGRSQDRLQHLHKRLQSGLPPSTTGAPLLTVAQSVEKAVRSADVVCTVTSSKTPVVQGPWVKPGCLVVCVGACRPGWQELDPELVLASELYVDSREAARAESGDVILSGAVIRGEIGELVAGRGDVARSDYGRVCVFKSLGLAVEDASTAKFVYDQFISRRS